MPSNLPPGYQIEGAPQQPSSGYRVEPMVTPAEQRAREEAEYRRTQDAIQRERQEASDRRAEEAASREAERLEMSRAAAAREARVADPTTPRATPEMRGRLEFGLPVATRGRQRLNEMEVGGKAPLNEDWGAALIDAIPDWGLLKPLARTVGGEDFQAYDQAAASIEAALLPIFSGMAVTPTEAERFIRANQPQLGDGPGRLREKATNVMEVLNAGARLAGRPMPFPQVGLYGVPGAEPQGQREQAQPGVGANVRLENDTGPDVMAPTPSTTPRPGGPTGGDDGWQSIPMRELRAGEQTFSVDRTRTVPADSPLHPDAVQVGPNEWVVPPADPMAGQDPEASRAVDELIADNGGEGQHAGAAALGSGATLDFADEIAARVGQAGVAAKNLVTDGEDDYTSQEWHDAYLARSRDISSRYSKSHPVSTGALRITGAMAAPGAIAAGRFVAGTKLAANSPMAARLMTGASLPAQMFRGSMVGTAAGAGYGTGAAEGDAADRLRGGVQGAGVGFMTGALGPVAGRVVGAGVNRLVVNPARGAARLVNKATGGHFGDPARSARDRLVETMGADGIDAATIQRGLAEWDAAGGPSPSFLDIISRDGGGQQTRALVRGAAMGGPARNTATQYANQVEADIQGDAISRTRQLTPEQRAVPELTDDLTRARSAQAELDYDGPYREAVDVSPEVQSALGDAPGRAALQRARAAAVARRNQPQVEEIDRLLAGEQGQVSAGTLDRTRIAMAERGRVAGQRGANDMAGGLYERAGGIDEALEAVPALGPARARYKEASEAIEGLEIGSGVRSTPPDQLAARMTGAPGARATAPVGAARSMEEAIGKPAEGSTGTLNVLGSSTNVRRNLALIFGEAEAGRFQQALQQIVERVQNARFINPNTGSQTAGRAVDEALVSGGPTSPGFWIGLYRKLASGQTTLTDQERQAIVKIATGSAADAPQARLPAGPLTPRMVPSIAGQNAGNSVRDDQPRVRMTR